MSLRDEHQRDYLGEFVSEHYLRRRAREMAEDLERTFPGRNYTVFSYRFKVPRHRVKRIG